MESFENKGVAWQDISLEEIRTLLAEEQIAKALMLARMRYEGVKSTPAEIDAAITASEGSLSADVWKKERDAIVEEIKELEAILRQYQQ